MLRGTAGQHHGRASAGQVDDTHILPEHALGDAGAERLGTGLLGGETLGIGGGAVLAAIPAIKPGSRGLQ